VRTRGWRASSPPAASRLLRFERESYHPPFDTWFAITAYPTSTGGIAVFFRDATVQKRAEPRLRAAALRTREEEARTQAARLEAVLDAVADGLVVYDRAGRTILSTRAADELLGIPAAERSAPVSERVARQYEIPRRVRPPRGAGRDDRVPRASSWCRDPRASPRPRHSGVSRPCPRGRLVL
jgi:PAS domain-containing protein